MNNTGGVAVTWQLQQQTQAIPKTSNVPVVPPIHGNFPFMQLNNGLQNQSSQPMQRTQPMHPMHWQQAQLTQIQLQQQMMQMQMQQRKKYYDMALKSQQTQLQQLRHVHMLKTLFMHNVNHPISSYEARSIVDIQPIAWSVNKPILPGLNHPPTFLESFHLLPPVYQLALSRVTVFKFFTRKATKEEYEKGLESTPDAAFFLKSLKGRQRVQLHNMLLGFRCQCCLACRGEAYVKGSTSFVDMGLGPQDAGIRDALHLRIRHLVACPCVSDQDKSRFATFCQVTTPHEKKKLDTFVTQWTQALLASHFPSTFPTSLLGISPNAVPWFGGDASCFADTIVSSDLFDALSFTTQLIRDRGLVFCDMGQTMQDGGFPPSLLIELISEYSVLRVTFAHETHRLEATLYHANCTCEDHGHLSLPSLISKGPLRKTLPTDVRDFVLSHAQSCPSIPYYNKQILKRLGDSVDNRFWYKFCMWWQTYLCKLLRGFQPPKILQSTSDCDYFRYITVSDRKKQSYKNLPLFTLPNPDPPDSPTMEETQLNYIFLHNDRYQDCVGNRWFRCQISKHRPLYLQASESVQEVMKKSILSFISKSGYSFVMVSAEGNCDSAPSDEVEKYVTQSLMNGFPEIMRPSVASNGESKVFDVDFAPRIGVLHENIQWGDRKYSDDEFTFPILKKDEAEAKSLSWRDAWPTPHQGLFQAIRTVNGKDDDQNLAISSVVTPTDTAASASNTTPELANQPDDTTPAGTSCPTSVVETTMNDSTGGQIPQDVTTLRDSNLLHCSRNKSAISPRRIQDSSNPNSAKKARTT